MARGFDVIDRAQLCSLRFKVSAGLSHVRVDPVADALPHVEHSTIARIAQRVDIVQQHARHLGRDADVSAHAEMVPGSTLVAVLGGGVLVSPELDLAHPFYI